MGADFKASASLEGIDDLSIPFSKGLRKAEKAAKRSFGRIERMGLRARRAVAFAGQRQFHPGKRIKQIGKMARSTLGSVTKLAGATTALGALAIDRFGKFELAVSRIGNLLTDDRDAVEAFGAQLKRISLQFGIDQIEAAEGAYLAFSGGVETSSEALADFLPAAAKLAKAGKTDLPTAIDALTTFKEIFPELSATNVSDLLFVTERLGKTDAGQIAQSIGGIAGVAKDAGVPIQQILAAIASITKGGKSTSEAVTQIGAVIKGIRNPAKELQKNFKDLGVPFGPLALRQAGGLAEIMQSISEISDAGAMQKLFGKRQEAIQGATRLTQTGLKPMLETADALADSAKISEKNWANMSRRTGFKVEQLKAGFAGLFTEFGGGLAEGLLGDKDLTPDEIADSFESAGRRVRSGAKNFAVGFVQALTPAGDFAKMNFDDMAKSAGKAFGKMITGLGKLLSLISETAEKVVEVTGAFSDYAGDNVEGGDTAVDKRERALGLETISLDEQALPGTTGAGASMAEAMSFVGMSKAQDLMQGAASGYQRLREARLMSPVRGPGGQLTQVKHQTVDEGTLALEIARAQHKNAAKRQARINEILMDVKVTLAGEGAKGAKVETKAKKKKGNAKVGKTGTRAVGT
jgi:TP901 family phage tail tape measure protein